jgi:hypothetical protein
MVMSTCLEKCLISYGSRTSVVGTGLTGLQCVAELRDKSTSFKETGRVNVLDAELNVVKSDTAVSETVRDALCTGVKALEDVPDRMKDWHPGSDGLVLDLVHPSLFPVVFGLTRAMALEKVPLEDCINYIGKGELTSIGETSQEASGGPPPSTNGLWGEYQWLPAEVELSQDGSVRIVSYINNLHPKTHSDLYQVLERIVAATVPLWNDCLSGFYDRRRFDIKFTGQIDFTYPEELRYKIPDKEGPKAWVDPKNFDDELGDDDDDDEWRYEDDFIQWDKDNRVLVYREPREYVPQDQLLAYAEDQKRKIRSKKRVNLREDYPEGLQVIFKLANIHLMPENPRYEGGSWHVEGALNEGICASAIYYYDQDNITDSHLAFRQQIYDEEVLMIPEQSNFASLEAYMGINDGEPAVQDLGQVLTREGRLLAFPNCVQHQVQPFELHDKTKVGYRKILAMFLIDPNRPVLSSANVPPQRRDWWAEEVRKGQALAGLPTELFEQTVAMVDDFPISWEQALVIREKVMAERSRIDVNVEDRFQEVSWRARILFRQRLTFLRPHSTSVSTRIAYWGGA